MKNVLSVLAGLICAVIIFSLFEFISSLIYPFPKDIDMSDTDALKEFISTVPTINMLIVLAGYIAGSLVGGFVVGKISKSENKRLPLITGGILTIAGIINLIAIPHPIWFVVINVLVYIPMVVLGHNLSIKKTNISDSYH